ncbi:MAG: 1,4-dihydroxy-2-naphthoate octaprenyltransferase [Bdellovibrionales bacterium]
MFFNLISASRPKTLIAGICPVILGACFSFYFLGYLDVFYFTLILTASVLIQVATNFFNDAIDGESGRDTKERKGPKRMASEGALSSKVLKSAAIGLLIVSFIIGLVLFLKAGWLVLLIGLPALFLAYLYTGTNYSLSANGIADLFVVAYFGIIPVWATNYILSGISSSDTAWAGLQCGLLCNVLLLVNNLRDEEEDAQTGKTTIVVKYGRKFGLGVLAVCLFLPYVMSALMMYSIFFRSGLWSFLGLPLAIYIFMKVFKEEPSKEYNKYLGLTALHLVFFTWMYSMGILSS